MLEEHPGGLQDNAVRVKIANVGPSVWLEQIHLVGRMKGNAKAYDRPTSLRLNEPVKLERFDSHDVIVTGRDFWDGDFAEFELEDAEIVVRTKSGYSVRRAVPELVALAQSTHQSRRRWADEYMWSSQPPSTQPN